MIDEMKAADPKVDKFPYIEFCGSPHEYPKTDDPYHVSVVLRKVSAGKGTGVTLHVYPDGTMEPSRKKNILPSKPTRHLLED
ncbi:hypothetical protein E4U23_003730 [Claviceps purpurea]|nr:hypothetical protein E4U10_007178 [Claviceps purpurea]KAG6247515.1 hypothetical protein E4U23_003730 [Claviceps purpurea]KAG6296421.1 hypothetical protein E4U45_005739 [Claviceps purpurea]